MFTRYQRNAVFIFLILLTGSLFTSLKAQQSQDPPRQINVRQSQNQDQFRFVDELGLQLTLSKFYEGFLDIETYRLGSGDLLGITLQGNVSGQLRGIRVNSQGTIMIPEVGVIEVRNMLLMEAEERINEKIQERLLDTRVSLTLEHPRSIKIHVVGNIPYTGPQLVLAQTRLDQAIYHSFFRPVRTGDDDDDAILMLANKYPTEFIESNRFNLRNIIINRADGSREYGDLIRYLKTGDQDANPIVEQDDIIQITRFYDYNPRVSVSGAVNRSLELEYHSDDTIDRLLRMAGGFTYDATEDVVRVIRSTEEGIDEMILDDSVAIANYAVQPNDRLIIPFERDRRATQNAQVYGEVKYTGRFPIKDGETTLYELLQLTGGLTDQALPQAAYLMRTQPGKTEYGTRPAFDPSTLRRTSDQYAQGIEYLNLEAQLIRNRVYVDLRNEDQLKNVKLFDGDRLHIPKNEGTIFVFGQVNSPGYYNFDADLTIDSYIVNAGGFALSADEERIFVVKAQTNAMFHPDNIVLEPGDLVFVDRVPFDELQAARGYDIQKRQHRNSNIQLIMTGLTTITGIITTYVAITR